MPESAIKIDPPARLIARSLGPVYQHAHQVPTVDTNLVQSLINIMECQLEEAFEAAQGGTAGGRKQSLSKSKASAEAAAEGAAALDPKVRLPPNNGVGVSFGRGAAPYIFSIRGRVCTALSRK